MDIEGFCRDLIGWFNDEKRDLPWRKDQDPYKIWVSEIMLQQTRVDTVIPYFNRFMEQFPTIEALSMAEEEKILKAWEGLGYYTRACNLQKAAQEICAKHHSKFPRDFDDILALPGIGRSTAGAIASIAFNEPKPILDGNVVRALTRVFGITENPRDKQTNSQLWQLAEILVQNSKFKTQNSKRSCSQLNQSLMELGALICTPRNPKCLVCPIQKLCVAFREDRVAELPNLGRRITPTNRRFIAFVMSRRGKFLVRQRPAGVVNANLWEFPNVEPGEPASHEAARKVFGFNSFTLRPLCSLKHSITRFRISLDVFHAELAGLPKKFPFHGRWCSLRELEQLSFPSAHRKILARLKSL